MLALGAAETAGARDGDWLRARGEGNVGVASAVGDKAIRRIARRHICVV